MNRWVVYGGLAGALALWLHFHGGTAATLRPEGGFEYPGYRITALEPFTIEARVLSRRDYTSDRESALAPTDLALGWGPMADESVLEKLDISQANRWYFWRATMLPIPATEIAHHSANMHFIAASPQTAEALAQVRPDERVRISGQLVEVRGDDGWHWRSSLSRTDTGASSCEVVWLERLEVL